MVTTRRRRTDYASLHTGSSSAIDASDVPQPSVDVLEGPPPGEMRLRSPEEEAAQPSEASSSQRRKKKPNPDEEEYEEEDYDELVDDEEFVFDVEDHDERVQEDDFIVDSPKPKRKKRRHKTDSKRRRRGARDEEDFVPDDNSSFDDSALSLADDGSEIDEIARAYLPQKVRVRPPTRSKPEGEYVEGPPERVLPEDRPVRERKPVQQDPYIAAISNPSHHSMNIHRKDRGPNATRRRRRRYSYDSSSDSDRGGRNRHKSKRKPGDFEPVKVDENVSFSQVGGLATHLESLKEMLVLPLMYPEVFESLGATPPKGVLFHGPPGCGKTLVARALARSCGDKEITFFMRKGADVLSKWVGEAERQLRGLFEEAKKRAPSVIFFDEIDGLAPVRSAKQEQIHSSIVSTLLALMDGLDGRGNVVVVGATNRPDAIDPALRRPGRFDRELEFKLPDLKARVEILNIHSSKWSPTLKENEVSHLAEATEGFAGADIRALCAEASLVALKRNFPQIYDSKVKLKIDSSQTAPTINDALVALERTRPPKARFSVPGESRLVTVRPLSKLQAIVFNSKMESVLGSVLRKVRSGAFGTVEVECGEFSDLVLGSVLSSVSSCERIPTFSLAADAFIDSLMDVDDEPRLYVSPTNSVAGFVFRRNSLELKAVASSSPVEVDRAQVDAFSNELASQIYAKVVRLRSAAPVREALPIDPAYVEEQKRLASNKSEQLKKQDAYYLQEFRQATRAILKRASRDPSYKEFRADVDGDEVKDYYQIVKRPMSLERMSDKLEINEYLCMEDVVADVELIVENVVAYHSADSPEYRTYLASARDLVDGIKSEYYRLERALRSEPEHDLLPRCAEIAAKKRGLKKMIASEDAPPAETNEVVSPTNLARAPLALEFSESSRIEFESKVRSLFANANTASQLFRIELVLRSCSARSAGDDDPLSAAVREAQTWLTSE